MRARQGKLIWLCIRKRNIVERFFDYLKQFRRVATRYDKHIQNYMGFVYIAAIKIWLK